MTDYNTMSLDEMYGELETRWFDSIHEADEMEREAQRRSAVVTAMCHLAADLDAEGLVVVPKRQTLDMLQAGLNAYVGDTEFYWQAIENVWNDMLAAAPLAPEVG